MLGLISKNEKYVARLMSEHGVYQLLAFFDKRIRLRGAQSNLGPTTCFL